MKIALVTGSTSGIGYEITKKLLKMGYIVYGMGRNFYRSLDDKSIFQDNSNFFPIQVDLSKSFELEKVLDNIKKINFSLIVNSAGIGYFGLHEEISISKIKNMIATNLEAPLIISQFFLRQLKKEKGIIINISSVTANKESPLAAVYSATKAGLSQFSKNLFEEVRKYDIKVINIQPDITKTNFYENNTYFEYDDNCEAYIDPNDIAETIEFVLKNIDKLILTEITLKPQKHRIKKKGNIKK